MKLKIILMAVWWDYANNYLTHQNFADAHGLTIPYAKSLADKGHTIWGRATKEERAAAIKLASKLA